ncbi:cAMP-activated global transcriptional regulator CRP [Methylogaea oryzae]|uniref:Transcriptional regulator Crp n=1 Tax=Methylogaea oryzae TaxID=1295382 RepID=A0A8D5AJV9_9GAMM|nr:cAMP-activated global transcriptional regulator CRP [Methylogaea oryzae]BBL72836.1 transcriptional regulator Crp [Methylogaea oryzae]
MEDLVNAVATTHPDMAAFIHHCHLRRFPAKYTIIKPGDKGETFFYIVEGSVSVSMIDADGHELVLAYINKGEFVGEVGVFLGEMVRYVTVRTREPCQFAEISYQRFHQLIHTDLAPHATGVMFMMAKQLAGRLLTTNRKVGDLAFTDVTGRISHTLMDLCKQPDAMTHPEGMQIRITRQELGRIVGCSREMAGRVLKELQNQKLIDVKGKTIVVYGTR